MVWQSVPEELTMSKEEAYRRYKNVNIFQQLVHSFDTDKPIPKTKDGEVDCYIMKGAKKNVISTYAWQGSYTEGGYVDAVVGRYLRRKYPEVLVELNKIKDVWDRFEASDKWRKQHRVEINELIHRMSEKYWLHHRTADAVYNNLNPFDISW